VLKRTLVAILLIGSAAFMPGCTKISEAYKPHPIYDEPASLKFTQEEKEILTGFAQRYPKLFKKMQGQLHAYRAIVQTHNKNARKLNKGLLSSMGYTEEQIEKIYAKPKKE